MIINVHLHTILQRPSPQGPISQLQIDLPEGSTLNDLIERLNIEMPVESLLIAVNHRMAEVDQVLQDGDQVNLMPAISGG
jgi:sulfur carrier protein ThiS